MKGRIVDFSLSFNRKQRLTLELAEDFTAQYEDLSGKDLSVNLKPYRKGRGLTANSYYWSLCGKLAKALNISSPHCHNLMLRRYGVLEDFDGKAVYTVIPDTDEAEQKVNESETYHLKPTSQVKEGRDGIMYRTYMLLKGSSGFDTAEMSRLISGIRDECRQIGIPYETPDEIANLISLTGGAV